MLNDLATVSEVLSQPLVSRLPLPGLAELRDRTRGDERIRVALLDGPAHLEHPAFRGARLESLSQRHRADGPALEHGTHIASILFSQTGGSTAGLAAHCTGLLRPIFSDDHGRVLPCDLRELSAAIFEAVDHGAHVINVSAGGRIDPAAAPRCLAEAVLHCERHGVLLVAAAGNDGCAECLHLPGGIASRAVLVVGAMNDEGQPLSFSNWGSVYARQGILAPGENIDGAVPPDRWEPRSGTSYATAVVTGVCALVLSLQLAGEVRADPLAVRDALLHSAIGCPHPRADDCARLLAGRLSLPRALTALGLAQGDPTVSERSVNLVPQGADQESASSELRDGRAAASPGAASPGAVCPAGSATISNGVDSPVQHGAPDAVVPSDCGCGGGAKGARQFVYAVGTRLDYDFGTRVRQESLEDNFRAGFLDEHHRSLLVRPNFLRYLLGWDGSTGTTAGEATAGLSVRGRLYDAGAVHWVLYQDECPAYVIAPRGPFSDVAYKELVYFFIESQGIALGDYGIDPECINGYLQCHGGLNDPLPSAKNEPSGSRGRKKDSDDKAKDEGLAAQVGSLLMEEPHRVARIAIAGEISGRAVLSTGETLEVIVPDMRGTASWNTQRLLDSLSTFVQGDRPAARALVTRIVAELYEAARNPGKSPEDRALNYTATAALRFIRPFFEPGAFTDMLGGLDKVAVDSLSVRKSSCQRTGLEYDVELSFFSFENVQRGTLTLTSTVDVSDVVPVSTGRLRFSTRR